MPQNGNWAGILKNSEKSLRALTTGRRVKCSALGRQMILAIFLLVFIAATVLAVGAILVLAIAGALGSKSSPTSLRQKRLLRRLQWMLLLLALAWGIALVGILALALPKG